MWRLIGRPEIARSNAIKAFLEFDKAMARAQQQQRCVGHKAVPLLLLLGEALVVQLGSDSGTWGVAVVHCASLASVHPACALVSV